MEQHRWLLEAMLNEKKYTIFVKLKNKQNWTMHYLETHRSVIKTTTTTFPQQSKGTKHKILDSGYLGGKGYNRREKHR